MHQVDINIFFIESVQCTTYFEVLKNLFPRGKMWLFGSRQPVLSNLVDSLSAEFCRVEERVLTLLREMDPSQADETLDEWKQDYRVPDECTPTSFGDIELRDQIVQKYTNQGGLSETYLEGEVAKFGVTVDITDCNPFVAGSLAGDALTNFREDSFVAGSVAGSPLTNDGWTYFFCVDAPADSFEIFVAGSPAGMALVEIDSPIARCIINKLKPAHTNAFFTFTGV